MDMLKNRFGSIPKRLTKMTLSNLEIGIEATITNVCHPSLQYKRRMMELGLIRGTIIMKESYAPLGDPMTLLVNGSKLAIRNEEAKYIDIELNM